MKKKSLLSISLGTLSIMLGGLSFAAPPEIKWNLDVYEPFPTALSGWFNGIQAIATDSDNNLTLLKVDYYDSGSWHAFSWNGVGGQNTPAEIRSDNNYAYSPHGGSARVFRASATDSAGENSAEIYIMAKVGPAGATEFKYSDFPSHGGSNGYLFPNSGTKDVNSFVMHDLINSLSHQSTFPSDFTIYFADGVHEFDLNLNHWVPTNLNYWDTHSGWLPDNNHPQNALYIANKGQSILEALRIEKDGATYRRYPTSLGSLADAHNVTFKAINSGGATLKWGAFTSDGLIRYQSVTGVRDTFIPEYLTSPDYIEGAANPAPVGSRIFPSVADQTAAYNHFVNSLNGTTPHGKFYAWPSPGPFLAVDSASSAIAFDGLKFTTFYDLKDVHSRSDNGSHITSLASNTTIKNCSFELSPGWNVTTQGDYTHINQNHLINSSGDGFNVRGNHNYIVGNMIYGSGDDSIAISEGGDNHVIGNTILASGWRAIYAHDLRQVFDGANLLRNEIRGNTIVSTAQHGIEISVDYGAKSYSVDILSNDFSEIGANTQHNTPIHDASYWRYAVYLGTTEDCEIDDNDFYAHPQPQGTGVGAARAAVIKNQTPNVSPFGAITPANRLSMELSIEAENRFFNNYSDNEVYIEP